MNKLVKKLGILAAGLVGLAFTSGCATSGSAISTGVSLRPSYYKYNVSRKVPAPSVKEDRFLMYRGPTEVKVKDGYDVGPVLEVKETSPVSEGHARYFSLSFEGSGQNLYSSGKEPGADGDISSQKAWIGDPRKDPSRASLKEVPSKWRIAPGFGWIYSPTEKTSITTGVNFPYNHGAKEEIGQFVSQGNDQDPIYKKIRKTESSGWGTGASLGLERKIGKRSILSLGVGGDKFGNARRAYGDLGLTVRFRKRGTRGNRNTMIGYRNRGRR